MENLIKEQQIDLFADRPRTLIWGIGGGPTSFAPDFDPGAGR